MFVTKVSFFHSNIFLSATLVIILTMGYGTTSRFYKNSFQK